MLITEDDGHVTEDIREFGAFTDELYLLKQWMLDTGCHVVAMESPGVYWKPVHNVLEDIAQVILVNAR
ncbi:MAG: IS110 family transposase, partial [Deltaproteobacteria bacterium]